LIERSGRKSNGCFRIQFSAAGWEPSFASSIGCGNAPIVRLPSGT
jgi:hypothetical protein